MSAPMATATPMQIAFWLGAQPTLPSIERIQAQTGCTPHMATRMHRFAAYRGRFDYGVAPVEPRGRKKLATRVCDALELQPMTTPELAQCLSRAVGSIERCITELRQMGCVRPVGKEPKRSGRPRNLWGLAS